MGSGRYGSLAGGSINDAIDKLVQAALSRGNEFP